MLFPYSQCTHHYIDSKAPALKIDKLHVKHYQDPKAYILSNIHAQARPGERLALIGRNGAGKSTLLQCIAGLIPYQEGQLSIFGHPPKACQHHVSYLPQNTGIDWDFPILVEDFVLTGRYVHLGWLKRPQAADYLDAQKALELLELLPLRKRSINQLSGGERQRTLLARTLIHKAQLLLLDEPLNAIDTYTQRIIEQTLDTLRHEGKTVVMATHDTQCLGSGFDQIIHLEEGKQKPSSL